jgi:hypothetical protein
MLGSMPASPNSRNSRSDGIGHNANVHLAVVVHSRNDQQH